MSDANNKALSPLNDNLLDALSRISKADAASSRAAIQAAQATKPSLHTRFVYDPAKGSA